MRRTWKVGVRRGELIVREAGAERKREARAFGVERPVSQSAVTSFAPRGHSCEPPNTPGPGMYWNAGPFSSIRYTTIIP